MNVAYWLDVGFLCCVLHDACCMSFVLNLLLNALFAVCCLSIARCCVLCGACCDCCFLWLDCCVLCAVWCSACVVSWLLSVDCYVLVGA